jgi:hypothetical protein
MNIVDNHTTEPSAPFIIEMEPSDELTELVALPPASSPNVTTITAQAGPTAATEPEFDAYMAIVRLLVGGTVEGTAELVRRLQEWEGELMASEGPMEMGQIHNNGDAARYMLVGMMLSSSDALRRQTLRFVQASDVVLRLTGNATRPLVDNRLTGLVARPIDRAFDRLVTRGQKRVNDWIELGRTQEPGARRLARESYLKILDEFIGHLAENEELADLVQEQSVGLASEAVDEIRSRTVSADALAEGFVRRILRRPPRRELPSPSEEILQAITDSAPPAKRP